MSDDPRCCGSGTCIIDGEGRCWCGQQWNGETMCQPPLTPTRQVDARTTGQEDLGLAGEQP